VSEGSTDAWFYTASGERIGPVTLADLRVLAASGELNPRLDLCWTSGMADWLPAGEIEGLFEKKQNRETKEALNDAQALPRNPQTLDKLSEQELEMKLLEARWPGISRRVYLVAIFIMPLIFGAAIAGMVFFMLDLEKKEDLETLMLVGGIASLVWGVFVIFMSLQRFKNLGMSGWWILGNLLPILNLWVGYRSMCCPAGFEFHRKQDKKGVFLAVLYWGSIGLSLILFLLALFLMFQGGVESLDEKFGRLMDLLIQQEEGPANVAPPSEP
jgi:uncharacterized membrane protein YhaH (DUF805 family)